MVGLTACLSTALKSMMITELKTNLSSQNITNADKAGYMRKDVEVQYITSTAGSLPVSGIIVGNADPYMIKSVVKDTSAYNYNITLSNSLDIYSKQLGSTSGTNSLSASLDDMYSALQYLSTNPEVSANKSEVVTIADSLTSSMRNLSHSIQALRLDTENKIATSVNTINSILDRISTLNFKIAKGDASNDISLANYQDQRDQELQSLSAEIGIQYFYNDTNEVQIFTDTGGTLLLSQPHHLQFTPTLQVNGSTTYPANFSPIALDGKDQTTQISSGKLAALVSLRDTVYANEQDKLDELATVLKTQVNTLLNTGASVANRNPVLGTLSGLTGSTAFAATGSIRLAVTNNAGTIVNYADVNLSAVTDITGLMTALNTVPGVSATLSGGKLQIAASSAANGIAINPLNSSVTSSTGQSLSQYFGLNDMFTGNSAENININDYLRSNPELLAIGVLSSSASLAVGERGVNRGDGSIADAIADLLNSNVPIAAAGDFPSQNNSLQHYAQTILSAAASKADNAQQQADISQEIYKASYDIITSASGVNVDEETAKLLQYQNQYEAGAHIISTVQEMLRSLMDAIR